MSEIPCGKNGFLAPGCCSDTCGSPYADEGDFRIGHECCSTVAGEFARLRAVEKAVRDLLATWERNRADPRYGQGAPGPLYVAGMATEADSMIKGLRAALTGNPKDPG